MGLVAIFVVVLILSYLILNKWRSWKTGSQIAGPPSFPLLGNIQFITQISPEDLFLLVDKLRKTYRRSFRLWLGWKLWVFLHSPEETRIALNEPSLVKADTFQLLDILIGKGLLISEGKLWHTHRRALGPSFLPNALCKFTKQIYEHSQIFVGIALKKRSVEVSDLLFRCVLDIIFDTSMGRSLCCQQDDNSPYVHAFHENGCYLEETELGELWLCAVYNIWTLKVETNIIHWDRDFVKRVTQLLFQRMTNPLLFPDFIYHRTQSYKQLCRSVKVVHGVIEEVIREYADNLQNTSRLNSEKCNRTLLYNLLTTEIYGQKLTLQEVKDEVNTFLLAGADTTSAALCFVFYCLAKYPEYQEKLYQEISTDTSEYPNVNNMTYLDMFVKECLRLYIIVPLTGRQVTRDIQIGNLNITQGTTLWINMYGLAHDEKYFPEPDTFKPERFAEGAPEIPPFAYIPFSGGPHACIGRKYGMLIIKILTVSTLMKAHLKLKDPNEKLVLMSQMVLKSKSGFNLIFEHRKKLF